jgi:Zn-dependent protease
LATVRTSLFDSPEEPGSEPALRLFRLFGIQFTANWSWLVLFMVLTYVAYVMFRGLRLTQIELIGLSLAAAVLSIVSLYGHELAHALVARAFGIPVRTISLFLLGGMAHITRESPTPRADFLIAVAGPAANLAIGVLGLLVSVLLTEAAPFIAVLGIWLAWTNVLVAVFNLLPAIPLDGGRVLRAVLWYAGDDLRWASTVAARVGQVAALGLLFAGVWVLFDGSTGAIGGLLLIVVAWFMYAGAVASQFTTLFHEALRQLTVASVMDRDFARLQAGASLQSFAEEHLVDRQPAPPRRAPRPSHGFAVYRDDALVGLLSLRALGRIPMQTWSQTNIERATLPIASAPALEPSAPALGALHLIVEEGAEQVAVMAEGRLLGLVSRTDLARAQGR